MYSNDDDDLYDDIYDDLDDIEDNFVQKRGFFGNHVIIHPGKQNIFWLSGLFIIHQDYNFRLEED